MLLLASTAVADSRPASAGERQIKSAFLYNFTKFIEWPAQGLPAPGNPMVIGVLDDDPLARELETIVRGRKVNGRDIQVREVLTADQVRGVQVLFVGADAQALFLSMRAAVEQSPVLTVGDSPSFIATGVAICFVPEGDKMRFAINMAAAERARLKISAQLQKLATSVTRAP